jgi:Putative sensor
MAGMSIATASPVPRSAGRAASGARRAALDLRYLLVALPTSIAAFVVWVTGVTLSLSLAPLIVGLPVMLGSAWAFRRTAGLDRRNAALVTGQVLDGSYRDHAGEGVVSRIGRTLADPQTWRDLAWLVAHSILGFTFGTIALALVGSALCLLFLPAWYWAVPDGVQFGLWTVDTLSESLATAALALPTAVVTVPLVRGMTRAHVALARALLG